MWAAVAGMLRELSEQDILEARPYCQLMSLCSLKQERGTRKPGGSDLSFVTNFLFFLLPLPSFAGFTALGPNLCSCSFQQTMQILSK